MAFLEGLGILVGGERFAAARRNESLVHRVLVAVDHGDKLVVAGELGKDECRDPPRRLDRRL